MSLNTKKIHVGELRIGMFVSELECDWLETPFLMQGFKIENSDEIDIIAKYSEHVWVDLASMPKKRADVAATRGILKSKSQPKVSYRNQCAVSQEHVRSKKVFQKARAVTKTFLDDVRLGGAIDTEAAKTTVNECVQSVIRHPDALMWMSKIRNENEYTAEHSLNVCILAIAFGRHLGLSEEALQNLGLCGLLHDVGKLRIPNDIIDKPGRLTEREMKLMQTHATHGRNLLMSAGNIYSGVIDVAYSHHERIDGEGYPRKLPGSGISRFSRIIAIVDAYDAMTADRCYQGARTSTEALRVIYNERGKHFDEHLALKFLEAVGLYPPGTIVELGTGEVGIVVETNHKFKQLPRIILLRDSNKVSMEEERMVDLALVEDGSLSRDHLVKQVWKDNSFGISLREYQHRSLEMAF